MIFDKKKKKEVIALLGAGSMGTAIVRRIAAGRKVLLGDISEKNLELVSQDFRYSGYDVETMIAKRVNHLQAQKAAATTWKERRARINTISPGVIVTPLAYDEFAATGDGYQNMIDTSAAERTGTSDEIAEAGAFLLGEHAGFITGTDLLIDGGVIASIRTGQYKLH